VNPSKRIAITTGVAALCIAVGAPAVACPPAPSSAIAADSVSAHKTASTPAEILARQQAWIDNFVDSAQAHLDAVAAKVAADPDISATKKVAIDAKLMQAEAALASLKAKADAATTLDELHSVVRDAILAWRSSLAIRLPARVHHKAVQRAVHRDTSSAIDAAAVQRARSVIVHSGYHGYFGRHRGDWGSGWRGYWQHHRGGAGFGGYHHHHHG
jgi:vancomycin resistance protein YoaR